MRTQYGCNRTQYKPKWTLCCSSLLGKALLLLSLGCLSGCDFCSRSSLSPHMAKPTSHWRQQQMVCEHQANFVSCGTQLTHMDLICGTLFARVRSFTYRGFTSGTFNGRVGARKLLLDYYYIVSELCSGRIHTSTNNG